MTEYLVKVNITAPGSYKVGIAGTVKGVYSPSSPIAIGWDYNGDVGTLTPPTIAWEPRGPGFSPGKTSKLVLTATAPTAVTIRME